MLTLQRIAVLENLPIRHAHPAILPPLVSVVLSEMVIFLFPMLQVFERGSQALSSRTAPAALVSFLDEINHNDCLAHASSFRSRTASICFTSGILSGGSIQSTQVA